MHCRSSNRLVKGKEGILYENSSSTSTACGCILILLTLVSLGYVYTYTRSLTHTLTNPCELILRHYGPVTYSCKVCKSHFWLHLSTTTNQCATSDTSQPVHTQTRGWVTEQLMHSEDSHVPPAVTVTLPFFFLTPFPCHLRSPFKHFL